VGAWAALSPKPDQPVKTEVVGLDRKPQVIEKKVDAPSVEDTPKLDPDLDAKLKAAAARDAEAAKRSGDNGFLQNLQRTSMASGEKMDTPDKIQARLCWRGARRHEQEARRQREDDR
jgi:hypothetical protein